MIKMLLGEISQNLLIFIFLIGVVTFTYSFQIEKTNVLKINFSLEEVQCYKGIFALFIVLDHLWMQCNMISLTLFHESAVILVSIFFFFSGYGISIKAVRNPDYMGIGFWKKRITGLVLPMLIVDLVMMMYQYVHGRNLDLKTLSGYLTGKELFNVPTWYIRELLICYICFYFLVKRNLKPKTVIFGCAGFLTVMNLVLFLCGYGYEWYGSNYGFIIGLFFGYLAGGGAELWDKPYTA